MQEPSHDLAGAGQAPPSATGRYGDSRYPACRITLRSSPVLIRLGKHRWVIERVGSFAVGVEDIAVRRVARIHRG